MRPRRSSRASQQLLMSAPGLKSGILPARRGSSSGSEHLAQVLPALSTLSSTNPPELACRWCQQREASPQVSTRCHSRMTRWSRMTACWRLRWRAAIFRLHFQILLSASGTNIPKLSTTDIFAFLLNGLPSFLRDKLPPSFVDLSLAVSHQSSHGTMVRCWGWKRLTRTPWKRTPASARGSRRGPPPECAPQERVHLAPHPQATCWSRSARSHLTLRPVPPSPRL